MGNIRIGFDIDGTITANPNLYARISREIKENEGEVHVVSSRSEEARLETMEELRGYGLQFDKLYLIPSISKSESVCPHPDLGWYEKFLWGKVGYALDWQLTHYVDDDYKVAALFKRYAAHVQFVSPDHVERLISLSATSRLPG